MRLRVILALCLGLALLASSQRKVTVNDGETLDLTGGRYEKEQKEGKPTYSPEVRTLAPLLLS